MDSPDWLRTQLTSFTCPACGRRYRGSRIKLLAERDGLFFVDLDCSRCGSHTVAIVTVELDEAELSIIDASDIELAVDLEPEHLGEELPVGAAPEEPTGCLVLPPRRTSALTVSRSSSSSCRR
jgi:transcription elongation factor Elf1